MAKSKPPKKQPEYDRIQKLEFTLPLDFWHLCNLLQIEPRAVLVLFMEDIGSRVEFDSGLAKQKATEYFLQTGLGQELFRKEDIRQMIGELGIVADLKLPISSNDKDFFKSIVARDTGYKVWAKKWELKRGEIY
jgi:hypothetical protein